jgi:hypothetical protein
MLNYLPEDHSERGYIAAAERLHGSLSFVFQPLLAEQRDAVDEARRFRSAREGSDMVATAITKALREWDLRDEHGCPVAVGLGSVRRLRPALLDKLYAVIAGWSASDPVLDVAGVQDQTDEARLLAAAGLGCTPCEMQQETD